MAVVQLRYDDNLDPRLPFSGKMATEEKAKTDELPAGPQKCKDE